MWLLYPTMERYRKLMSPKARRADNDPKSNGAHASRRYHGFSSYVQMKRKCFIYAASAGSVERSWDKRPHGCTPEGTTAKK